MMIETLRNVRKVFEATEYVAHGEMLRANLELSPQKKPVGKARALFYKALAEAQGNRRVRFKYHSSRRSVLLEKGACSKVRS